jgi:hypothetical protein
MRPGDLNIGPIEHEFFATETLGRSRKENTERGRWGLGKTIFAATSRVNAFFGLTIRRNDRRPLLMGQAVLCINRVGENRYRPYGYWGKHQDALSLPVTDPGALGEFGSAFGLQRRGPGLSIVIPFPHGNITRDQLLESVLHHYFHPLLSGRLEVQVEEHDTIVHLLRERLETLLAGTRRSTSAWIRRSR